MSEEWTAEEVHHAADRVVEELLEAAGVSVPPVDALALALNHLHLTVKLDEPHKGRKQVLTPPEPTKERTQWAAAQAIGAHLKGAVLQRLGIEPHGRGMMGESLTNLVAQRVIVPTPWLAGAARACGNDLLELKERFSTASHETIAWRWLDLPAPCIITVIDNDEIARRRSNAWRTRRELAPAERECQRYISQYSRPHVIRAGGWTVQGWPVHQADWKREILRSVVEEGEE